MPARFDANNLSVKIIPGPDKVLMEVVVPEQMVGTETFPNTLQFLQENCATVLDTRCFNPLNLPFKDEVVRTEVAHLFEHIILDMMVRKKAADGADHAKFSGETRWNWNDNPVGTFEVELRIPQSDQHYLELILPRAIELIEELIAGKK